MIRDIIHAFAQYKTLSIIFAAALVLTVFMVILASRAVRRHNRERDALLKKYKEEDRLRKQYAVLTEETAQNADSAELLHATALRIQHTLEKESDMNSAFSALPEAKQTVYALNYVLCEEADTLSAFFRAYGQPLTGAAMRGAEQTFPPSALETFRLAYAMFDDTDETVSCTKESVQKVNESFAGTNKQEILDQIKAYIIQNIQVF